MPIQKKNKKNVAERHLGVVLEDINSKFDRVLEGHAGLGKDLKDFKHETSGELRFVKFALRTLNDGQKDMITRFDRLEDKYDKNFEHILVYLSRIDDEIQDLKRSLIQKSDLQRLQNLEERVVQMELVVKKWQK